MNKCTARQHDRRASDYESCTDAGPSGRNAPVGSPGQVLSSLHLQADSCSKVCSCVRLDERRHQTTIAQPLFLTGLIVDKSLSERSLLHPVPLLVSSDFCGLDG